MTAAPSRSRALVLLLALLAGAALVPGVGPLSARSADAGVQGMFKVRCNYSHSLTDDPIVYPGQPGKAHRHDFFGNTSTNARSTDASLRAAGTTCENKDDKAAYWAPSFYQDGRLVVPQQVQTYYRGSNRDDRAIRVFPAGLRMVAGNAHATGPQRVDVAGWTCEAEGQAVGNFSATMPTCSGQQKLRNRIRFPECWDGVHLDSADHTSHMSYLVGGRCPASHPVAVPRLDIEVHYGAVPGGASRTSLSSGGWQTLHADFINVWNQTALQGFVSRCLNTPRKCGVV